MNACSSTEHYTAFNEIRAERVNKMVARFSKALAAEMLNSPEKQDACEFMAAMGIVLMQCIELTIEEKSRDIFHRIIEHQTEIVSPTIENLLKQNIHPTYLLASLYAQTKLLTQSAYISTGEFQFNNLDKTPI